MISSAILQTLAYADIFGCALTKEELWKFLISSKTVSKAKFEKYLQKQHKTIVTDGTFYALFQRNALIQERKVRIQETNRKIELAQKASMYLKYIPSVFFIGISGTVAMKNAQRDEDIDVLVITASKTVWITRLLLLFVLELLGRRRKKGQKRVKDLICLNMLLTEDALEMPHRRRTLYVAHEIAQMMPIFERNHAYERFLKSNLWIKRYLPNSIESKTARYKDSITRDRKSLSVLVSYYLSVFEQFAKSLQLFFMKKHQKKQHMSDSFLAFYPKTFAQTVEREYKKRLKRL